MSIKLLKLHFQYLLFNLKCSRQVTIWLVDRQLLENVQSNQATEAVNRSNCSNPLYFLLLSLLLIYFLLLNFFFYFSSFIFSPFYTHRNNDNSSSSSYFFTRVPVVGSVVSQANNIFSRWSFLLLCSMFEMFFVRPVITINC